MKAKITCIIGDCEAELELSVAPADRSVGIMGATIEEVSGSCEHVQVLNDCLDSQEGRKDFKMQQDLYEAFEESFEDDYEPSEKDMDEMHEQFQRGDRIKDEE